MAAPAAAPTSPQLRRDTEPSTLLFPAEAAAAAAEDDLHFRDLWHVVVKRKWSIVAVFQIAVVAYLTWSQRPGTRTWLAVVLACYLFSLLCKEQGVLLMYAEELFFTPKYVKAKEMADQNAFGKLYLVKQSEKHFGPHASWFWDIEQSGGGVFMDMGCHGAAFVYWFLNRPKLLSVTRYTLRSESEI